MPTLLYVFQIQTRDRKTDGHGETIVLLRNPKNEKSSRIKLHRSGRSAHILPHPPKPARVATPEADRRVRRCELNGTYGGALKTFLLYPPHCDDPAFKIT